jgi:hypothetical protein
MMHDYDDDERPDDVVFFYYSFLFFRFSVYYYYILLFAAAVKPVRPLARNRGKLRNLTWKGRGRRIWDVLPRAGKSREPGSWVSGRVRRPSLSVYTYTEGPGRRGVCHA